MTFVFPRSYLSGLVLSTAGSSATFGVGPGQATDSDNTAVMNFPAAMSKTTSAWAAGTGNGALDTPGSITINAWHRVFLIGTVDVNGTFASDILVSLSATPALPDGYTISRRIGWMKTDGAGNWIAFTQFKRTFIWASSVNDVNNLNTPSSRTLVPLPSVPPDVNIVAKLRVQLVALSSVTTAVILVTPTSENEFVSNGGFTTLYTAGSTVAGETDVISGASQGVAVVCSTTNATYYLNVFGWVDDPSGE